MRSDIRCVLLQALACALLSAAVAGAESKALEIFFVDVEGGHATLIVTPSGQSMLIDTGWPGFNGRDADRIVSAAKAAGIERIDYVLITHFHRDHVGGVTQLASQIKIGTFVDHGPNMEDAVDPREDYAAYEKVAAHPGLHQSNARVSVDALRPRVSIMNNGAHKGGSPDAWETIRSSPGLQDLWQLHYAMDSDKAHNVAESFIANVDEKCAGKYTQVTAEQNGTFTVLNSRNGYTKTYSK